MQADQIHPTFRQALGCHEGFRRLGFRPEELFVLFQRETKIFYVQLQTQGKRFSVGIGTIDGTEDEVHEQWMKVTEAVRSHVVSEEVMQQCWAESAVYADPNGFVSAIVQKGFAIPNAQRMIDKSLGLRKRRDIPRES